VTLLAARPLDPRQWAGEAAGPSLCQSVSIELEHDVAARLRREAARREMPVRRLIHESLNTIVTDQLTTAILG
jgi:hypothetical protein